MIYVTVDEYINLVKKAVDQSNFIGNNRDRWHPDDLHTIFETVAHTVKVVLENAPVERKYQD